MRKISAAAAVAASILAASVVATGTAHAFNLQGGGGTSPQTGSTSLDPGSRYTAPDDKLLSAPLGGLDVQTGTGDGRSVHFGDKNGGLTLQGSPTPGPTGAARYWSMENNPWR